jgi:hypothetical protein
MDVACPTAGIWTYEWIGTGTAADDEVGTWTVASKTMSHLYCTVEEIKSRMHIEDTDDDFEVTFAVQTACMSIEEICGRYFWRGTATRTYVPRSYQLLEIDDCLSITTLKTDDNGDGVYENTWTEGTDFVLEVSPKNHNVASRGEDWPYTQIRCLGTRWLPQVYPYYRQDRVQIVGTFGWPAVPLMVKQAALIAAADLFKIKDAPFGAVGYGEFGLIRVQQNPRVMSLLRRYIDPDVKVGV